jgi:iron complex transport system substrate-binding protein
MGLKTIDLPFPASIGDVERNMVRIASALGDTRRAAGWRRKLAQLQQVREGSRDTIFLTSGGYSVSASSVGAQWMRLAGFNQRSLPGGRASLETLALSPPSVLLRSTYRQNQQSLGQAWLAHPLARSATSKSVWTDGRPWTCMGPLMLPEIERLRREN